LTFWAEPIILYRMKGTYEVRILNQKFHLKTDQDELHVKQISDYVNKIFHEIGKKNGNISTQNIAILGALNIAEELFSRHQGSKQKVSEWKQILETVIKKITLSKT